MTSEPAATAARRATALGPVRAVGHRGDPYRHRENTLPSLRSALLAGADAVEFDVRLSRDGVPLLLHDRTLERLWEHDAAVSDLTAEEVRRLTADGVPTLAAALGLITAAPVGRALIDLAAAEQAAPVLAAVDAAGARDRTYYCGDLGAMLEVRRRDPDAEIALTWTTSARPKRELLATLRPRWINLRFGLIDAELVGWAHDRGLLVAAWTVDTGFSMRRLRRLGVDAVTSNRIDALRRALSR